MDKSQDLKVQEDQRDQYYQIKAAIQAKNAQIERERAKLEKQIQMLLVKKQSIQKEFDLITQQLEDLSKPQDKS